MELHSRWTDGIRIVSIERLEINPLEDKDTIYLVSIEGRHSSIQRSEFKRKYVPLVE